MLQRKGMDETATKLESCFRVVFPALDPAAITSATVNRVPQWDSVAQITLLNLIGEEFGIDIDFEEFEGADSFAEMLARLRERLSCSAADGGR
jgi:acyl carrier protein